MKRIWIAIMCIAWSTVFALAREPRLIVAPAPAAPADSILRSDTALVASVLIDSLRGETLRESHAVTDMKGVDSIGVYTTDWTVTREDSMRIINTRQTYRRDTIHDEPKPDSLRTGHYIQFGAGLGYGKMGTRMEDLNFVETGHGAMVLQLQYAYFFHPNWGVSAGLGMSTYAGSVRWEGDRLYEDATDTDGERYTHHATARNWREREHLFLFDIPIALQYQHMFNKYLGLYGAVGVNLGFPVMKKYRLVSGTLTHTGLYTYPDDTQGWGGWKYEVSDVHDFYSEDVKDKQYYSQGLNDMKLQPIQVAVRGDLGFVLPMSKQIDLLLGGYFRYTCNDMQVSDKVDVAWRHSQFPETAADGEDWYKRHDFMGHDYVSLLETKEVKRVHPWQAGVKIGMQWHYVDRNDHAHIEYNPYVAFDTTRYVDPRTYAVQTFEYDTVMTPVEEIRRLMYKAIIWFELDSYDPIIEPADILDQMAAVLIAHPDLRCEVNGHTCTIGARWYNQKLSVKRANAVRDRLIALGVKPEQLEVHGYCSDIPYYSVVHDKSLDRRCEIVPIEETNEEHVIHKVIKGKK